MLTEALVIFLKRKKDLGDCTCRFVGINCWFDGFKLRFIFVHQITIDVDKSSNALYLSPF